MIEIDTTSKIDETIEHFIRTGQIASNDQKRIDESWNLLSRFRHIIGAELIEKFHDFSKSNNLSPDQECDLCKIINNF